MHEHIFLKEKCKGEIRLNHVGFRYPTRRRVKVLRNLNITVKPGQTVALVGTSGSGKSTTVSLVERFYDANTGAVVRAIVCLDTRIRISDNRFSSTILMIAFGSQ